MAIVEESAIPYVTFWSACLALLCVGAACVAACVVTIWQHRERLHPINQAAALMFLADISMIVNFLPREVKMVYDRALETSAWCTVSAVWTISSCVALSAAAACIAYVTWQTLENRVVPFRTMALWCATGWVTGLAIASSFGAAGLLGPFRGIYCCTKSNSVPEVALPVLVVFVSSLLALVHFYRKALAAADRAQRVFAVTVTGAIGPAAARLAVPPHLPLGSSNGNSNAAAGTAVSAGAGSVAGPSHAVTGRHESSAAPVISHATSPATPMAAWTAAPTGDTRHADGDAEPRAVPLSASPLEQRQLLQTVHPASGPADTLRPHASDRVVSPRSAVTSVSSEAGRGDAHSPATGRAAQQSLGWSVPVVVRTVGTTRSGGVDLRDAIARRARLLVLVFYACWSLTSLNAFAALCGAAVPIESDMIGAFLLKLQPVIDSLVLIVSIRRGAARAHRQHRDRLQTGGSQPAAAPVAVRSSQYVG